MILVVEDSDEDFTALERVLKQSLCKAPIHRVRDGDEAIDYLYRQGPYANAEQAPRPSIILMDLNLPGTDGRDVIQQIKHDYTLKIIPVVVLTSSSNPKDVRDCYQNGTNSYMLKPMGLEQLKFTITDFLHYWLELAIIPDSSINQK
ncbi:response regulator [Planktothrix sp. FACHB-1355]|uniref:Response regulator n=1 Tax=Aerosakkonema funiforme FACHB-1375 TaxID=2949571 RepID=A0A926ZIR6_9CYAN|nr:MULTISPECIES: response regulator [Oscillatoriales]MBD2183577.1 response regulator [Aerosakkonema funiforme FACHB-1375]MBD3562320.1 response regulator [Planktothrix sp. FACHB-1355]